MTPVLEGTHIPETRVSVKSNLVKLQKIGRMITASYEAIKHQRLDLFTIALRQIGSAIAGTQAYRAVDALLEDDGTDGKSEIISVESIESFSYNDLLSLWSSFRGFNLSTIIMGTGTLTSVLKMDEFKDSAAGFGFHTTGKLITPFGAEIIHFPYLGDSKIIALDKASALERVQAGGIVTEFDKLIDRQLERASVTVTSGFAKIYNDAVKCLIID